MKKSFKQKIIFIMILLIIINIFIFYFGYRWNWFFNNIQGNSFIEISDYKINNDNIVICHE